MLKRKLIPEICSPFAWVDVASPNSGSARLELLVANKGLGPGWNPRTPKKCTSKRMSLEFEVDESFLNVFFFCKRRSCFLDKFFCQQFQEDHSFSWSLLTSRLNVQDGDVSWLQNDPSQQSQRTVKVVHSKRPNYEKQRKIRKGWPTPFYHQKFQVQKMEVLPCKICKAVLGIRFPL